MLSGRLMRLRVCDNGTGLDFPFGRVQFSESRGLHGSASSRARRSWTAVCTGDGAMGRFQGLCPRRGGLLGVLLTGVPTETLFFLHREWIAGLPRETFVISDEVPATTATTGTVVAHSRNGWGLPVPRARARGPEAH